MENKLLPWQDIDKKIARKTLKGDVICVVYPVRSQWRWKIFRKDIVNQGISSTKEKAIRSVEEIAKSMGYELVNDKFSPMI